MVAIMMPHLFRYTTMLMLCFGLMACASGNTSSHTLLKTEAQNGAETLRVATFNIHYLHVSEEGLSKWENRRKAVTDMIEDISPDIMAFQEMESFGGGHSRNENIQLDWVLSQHPDFKAAAYSDNASNYPITQPIIYRSASFDFVEQGFFFFSETPDRIYSPTFNGSYPAFCSWATLRDKTSGQSITIFNMHTDYSSGKNRIKSIDLIAERIKPHIEAGKAVLLMGDLNASNRSKIAKTLKSIPLKFVPSSGSTFHFNRGVNFTPAIDHILHTPQFIAKDKVTVWRKKYDGNWPSDHYPVIVDFNFKN